MVPHIVRRAFALCILIVLAAGGSVALGSPNDVIRDYVVDGQINGTYSVSDLQGALAVMKQRTPYGSFNDVVSNEIVAVEAGLHRGQGSAAADVPATLPKAGAQSSQEVAPASAAPVADRTQAELPTSPPVDPGSGLPLVFVVLSVLAGLLVLTGVGSTAFRRLRR